MDTSTKHRYKRATSQPENPFAQLIPDQTIVIIPSFKLESEVTLYNVPVAYSTRGSLSTQRDNAMVICHALSGSADVADWWGPLLGGPGRAFDVSRFFVVCINSLGSPYGTASPVTNRDGDPDKGRYGPEFPLTTVRDDVRLAKLLIDDLGVKQIAAVIGGSMGGMLVLEFAYFGKDYVRTIVPIATSSRHSAWCISWGEAQRQSIYCDDHYMDGYYEFANPPSTGLGAARMAALLTYRSRDSFESRFGRNVPSTIVKPATILRRTSTPADDHFAIHNDGHRHAGSPRLSRTPTGVGSVNASGNTTPSMAANDTNDVNTAIVDVQDPQFHGATPFPMVVNANARRPATTYFSAQSYLRYQGDKFIRRFDANCYISLTRKLDTHDVSQHAPDPDSPNALRDALNLIAQPTLVLGIQSDGLFTFAEQEEIAACIPRARLETIDSSEGHDAFLLQFEQVNASILHFLQTELPDIMAREPKDLRLGDETSAAITKNSTFGEAEVDDITAW